ncbi:MAG: glycosyltransferase family 4 protein [Pyrinomonadaceae bacterium]
MKILITAPSLETSQNVSGISSVVRQIIERGNGEFYHFAAGRRDGERIGISWFFRQISGFLRFRREIREKQIDVVHLNTALAPLSIMRDAALARIANRPIVLHLHGGRFFTQKFDNSFFERLTGKMLRRAKIVVVLSETEKEFIESRWQNPDVRILENSVALDEIQTRKPEASEKTMIFLGRLHEDKGLREIVETCRVLKSENFQFNFKCFGAGGAKEKFISEMTDVLGEKFFYGGIVSGAEKWKALSESDIFLLPSRYEGLPVAMLEAMAAGCVPVVSEIGSINLVVKDGINGFLIEPQNVPQTVEKLRFLLSDKAEWENLRRNARKTVEEKFNLKNYIEKLENIYAEIDGRS